MFAQSLHPTWDGGQGSRQPQGNTANQAWPLTKPPFQPSWPHGSPSQVVTRTGLYNGGLIAGTHGQHFEHAAGGPQQLLITVVAHDLHEGLGSSVGQDDELWGEGEDECETDREYDKEQGRERGLTELP